MKLIKTQQSEILSLLQSVAGIVERRFTLPILANLLLIKKDNELQVISTDLEIQISAKAALGGEGGDHATTVAARKLIDILRTLPSDQVVTVTPQENKLVLQAGKSRFTLLTLPPEEYPIVPESTNYGDVFTIPQKTFKNLLQQISFAMAVQDIRYYLNGILFVVENNKLSIVATDGHRLAYSDAELDTHIQKQEVILPRKTVLELLRLLSDTDDKIDIQFANNQAKFKFGDIEFISKLVEGKFPDYNRVIPKEQKNKLVISRLVLLTSLQRVAILTNEKFKGVRLNFEKNLMRITSVNADQEEAMEEIDVEYSGESIEIGFNVTYLIDAFSNMTQEMVEIAMSDGNSSVLFLIPNDKSYRYVVMPMRI